MVKTDKLYECLKENNLDFNDNLRNFIIAQKKLTIIYWKIVSKYWIKKI